MERKNHERPMIEWYWRERQGGTIIFEFELVPRSEGCGRRCADALILPGGKARIARQDEVSLRGKDVIVVQAKIGRLGMSLMGQAIFSAVLVEKFEPASVASVALCEKSDSVLKPLLAAFPEVEVVVINDREQTGGQTLRDTISRR